MISWKHSYFNYSVKLIFKMVYICQSTLRNYNNQEMSKEKIYLAILVLLVVTPTLCTGNLDQTYNYTMFKHQFRKKFDENEDKIREASFNKHMEYIKEKRKQGIQIPINDLMVSTDEQLRRRTGLSQLEQKVSSSQLPKLKVSNTQVVIPDTLDYRKLGKVSKVKNQGECGACWAFSATALYESLLLIYESKEYDLSQQFMMHCGNGSCEGGWPHHAIQSVKNKGMPLQAQYEYKPDFKHYYGIREICSADTSNFVKLSQKITDVIYHRNFFTNVEELKRVLVEHGPLIVGVYATDNHFYYPPIGGRIDNCPKFEGIDHSVLLVGWTATHWIIKNSWGQLWGQGGFATIPFHNDCGILNHVWLIEVEAQEAPRQTYTIQMHGAYGKGWSGAVLGFIQENQFVATFGSDFITGYSKETKVTIKANKITRIGVVATSLSQQMTQGVGFNIIKSDGTKIFQRNSGSSFGKEEIFDIFCPLSCIEPLTITYQVFLSDSYGDGWNQNTIKFIQNQSEIVVGAQFKDGYYYGPINITVKKGFIVEIKPDIIGTWRLEVELTVKDDRGSVVFQRLAGNSYYPNENLGSFCPECFQRNSIHNIYSGYENQENNSDQLQKAENSDKETDMMDDSDNQSHLPFIIVIICLSVFIVFLIGFLIFVLKCSKNTRNDDIVQVESIGTSQTIQNPYNPQIQEILGV